MRKEEEEKEEEEEVEVEEENRKPLDAGRKTLRGLLTCNGARRGTHTRMCAD